MSKMTEGDRKHLHELCERYYNKKEESIPRETCVRCGGKRKLGVRGKYEGLCGTCRSKEWQGTGGEEDVRGE